MACEQQTPAEERRDHLETESSLNEESSNNSYYLLPSLPQVLTVNTVAADTDDPIRTANVYIEQGGTSVLTERTD